MIIPSGATVAVVDGEKLNLFRNSGPGNELKLSAIEAGAVKSDNHGSGARHHTSSANPDHGQAEEDSHSAGVAAMLNAQVLAGGIEHLLVIASPKALGELRKHFSKQLSGVLVGEIAKDLTGHSLTDVEKAINAT
jgi:protein required for attachment to host cells